MKLSTEINLYKNNAIASDIQQLQNTTSKTIKTATTLYYLQKNETPIPSAPTAHVITTGDVVDTWTTSVPVINKDRAGYAYYYTCTEYRYSDETYTWSKVEYDRQRTFTQGMMVIDDNQVKFDGGKIYASDAFIRNIFAKDITLENALMSKDYNGTISNPLNNSTGTILKMDDGTLNIGGGKIKWDGTNLIVNGIINAASGQIGDFTLANGALYTGSKSADGTNIQGIRLSSNELNLSGGTATTTVKFGKGTMNIGSKLLYDNINGLVLDGNLTATNGTITGATLNGEDLNISAEREFNIYNFVTDENELLVRKTNIETVDNLSSEFGSSKLQIQKSLSIGDAEASSYLTMETLGLVLSIGTTIDTKLELGTSNIDGSSKISLWNGIMKLEASSLSLSASNIQFTCSDTSSRTYTENECSGNVLSSASIVVKEIYGTCFVSGGITLTGTVSDWVQILDSSAIPIPLHLTAIYQTACRWASSYERGLRVRINSSGGLSIRYGGAYEYRFDFSYPC